MVSARPELLDAPVDALALPSRIRWLSALRPLRTLRDLIALPPEEAARVRNFGPKAMKLTNRAIQDVFGASWEELHAQLVAPSIDQAALREKLAMPVTCVFYPPRLERVLASREIRTVGELAALDPSDISETYGCGPGTMQETRDALRAFLGVNWTNARNAARRSERRSTESVLDLESLGVDPAARMLPVRVLRGRIPISCQQAGIVTIGDLERRAGRLPGSVRRELMIALRRLPKDLMLLDCASWDAIAVRALERLAPRQASIVRQSLGLGGAPLTLAEIGRGLGITPVRVSQILSRALDRWRLGWSTRIAARLGAVIGDGAPLLESLGSQDSFFVASRSRIPSLARFVGALDVDVCVHRIGGRWAAAALEAGELRRRVSLVEAILRTHPGVSDAANAVARLDWPPRMTRDIFALLQRAAR